MAFTSLLKPSKPRNKSPYFSPQLCGIDEDNILLTQSPTQSIQQQLKLATSNKKELKLNPYAIEFMPSFDDTETTFTSTKPQTYTKIEKFIPAHKPRAKLNIYIGKHECRDILTELKEPFSKTSYMYHYLDVTAAFQMNDNQMYIYQTIKQPKISFINCDLHNKNTNEAYYGIVLPNDKNKIQKCNKNGRVNNTKWLWKLDEFLTAEEIYKKYDIPLSHLPKSSREMRKFITLKESIIKQKNINVDILNSINWSNDNIRQINRATKSLSKQIKKAKKIKKLSAELDGKDWMDKCTHSWNDFAAIPILVYENGETGFRYWVEWVKLVRINEHKSYIGMSFKQSDINSDKFLFQAIYLDKNDIFNKHRLFGHIESNYTEYFDKFEITTTGIQWMS